MNRIVEDDECVILLDDGKEIRCPAFPAECEYVRVVSPGGDEIGYWHYNEFEEDARDVLGALMGLLNTLLPVSVRNHESK